MAMVGWTPSILRAGIMTILSLLAWYSGRVFAPWRIILIVMAATLMINPGFMVDMGWQLSFASYAGIMIIAPRMTKFFYGMKKPGFMGSMIIATVAATIMTLPIILYHYGMVSLISVVANLLILPTLPYAMGLVFLTGVFAGMPVISAVISWGAEMLLKYHIMIVSWFGEMQQFLVEIPKYQMWVFGIYVLVFVILIMVIFGKYRKRSCYNSKYEQ
jgi:competence protein ComEC